MENSKELMEFLISIKKDINELKGEVYRAIDKDYDEAFISFRSIADKYGVTYQGVHKKVHNNINPMEIRKVKGLLSIPKTKVRYLNYTARKEV